LLPCRDHNSTYTFNRYIVATNTKKLGILFMFNVCVVLKKINREQRGHG